MLKQRSNHNPSIISNTSNTNNSIRNAITTDNTNEIHSQESSTSSTQPVVSNQLPVIEQHHINTEQSPAPQNVQSRIFNASEKGISQIKKGSESNNKIKNV